MKDFKEFVKDLSAVCKGNTTSLSKMMSDVLADAHTKSRNKLAKEEFKKFINSNMSNKYTAALVDKDIEITRLVDQVKFPFKLKIYNSGGFELFPDADNGIFNHFYQFDHLVKRDQLDKSEIVIAYSYQDISTILNLPAFKQFLETNTLVFIYDLDGHKIENQYNDFRLVTFDSDKMLENLDVIKLRTHWKNSNKNRLNVPLFNFYDKNGVIICHYCYGGEGQERGLQTFAENNHKSDGKPKSNIYWKDVMNGATQYLVR